MQISDEAVEAAYDKFFHLGLSATEIEGILEAAAPHIIAPFVEMLKVERMKVELLLELKRPPEGSARRAGTNALLAAAWDEGWFAARDFYVSAEKPELGIEQNPHRSQG